MLTRESLNSAVGLTELMDARRVTLVPVPDTPLAALVAATRANPLQAHTNDATTIAYTPDLDYIETIANFQDPETGLNQHDQAVNEIAGVVIPAVRNHINFARTVVAPLVEELGQKTGAALAEMTPTSLAGAEVVTQALPAPYSNSGLESMISRFVGQAYDSPPLALRLPDIEDLAAVKAMFQTGTASLDSDIEAWLAECGDAFIQEVWEGVFQVKPVEPGKFYRKNFSDWVQDPDDGECYALAIFLLARHLIDKVPAGTEQDLRQYENLCAAFRDQAANAIAQKIERQDQCVKNGVLVLGQHRLRVTVNAEVYRKWIEAGGENEVLFGNALQRMPFATVAEIDANASQLREAWTHHCGLVSTVERNKRFNTVLGLLERHFTQQLNDGAQNDPELQQNGAVDRVLKTFRDELQKVVESDLDNLYTLSLRLICKSRFPEHAAFEILSGIDRNKRENPHLDVRECAMLSIYEYVFSWVASMIRPVVR